MIALEDFPFAIMDHLEISPTINPLPRMNPACGSFSQALYSRRIRLTLYVGISLIVNGRDTFTIYPVVPCILFISKK